MQMILKGLSAAALLAATVLEQHHRQYHRELQGTGQACDLMHPAIKGYK